jgi:hypothetical protein
LIDAEILEAQQFFWRRNFTRRGDFNVRLSSIIYYQAHEFCMSAANFRSNFPQKFFCSNFPQQFSTDVFRNSFPQEFSAAIFRMSFPQQISASVFRLNFRHPPQFS